MVQFDFTYDPSISVEQRVGFELAAMIWGSYLTDDITVNLHIASSDSLGENGQAVGGAIPLFHEQNYGVYQQYAEADATSATDDEALASQQTGNTVDFLVDGQVVDGNTDILLTSAQAKALGMDEALELENGGTWDRDLVDADALDGYILVSNHFDWNYDYTRSGEAPEGTLDFMSMALHEIGHQLGFVSSLDGTLDMNTLHSGATQAEGFSVLDLFRHSIESTEVGNPDGAVTDLSLGQNSYFSTDGGETNLANFANGVDYQASHWKRMQVALGIMDPTLAYKERVSLNALDLQAMDVLGWDVNYNALDSGLDLDALLTLAENKVETSLGLSSTALDSSRGGGENGDLYALGYGEWWAIFEKHVLELGYGEWWSIFEMGYDEWKQQFENGNSNNSNNGNNGNGNGHGNGNGNGNNGNNGNGNGNGHGHGHGNGNNGILELGYGEWWQAFEANVLELGYGEWWQTFEADMLELGYGEWWQLLELGYGEWWQQLETFFFTLDKVEGNASEENSMVADGGVAGKKAKVYRGGEDDDIISGDKKQDRIKAGAGDDLVDGKKGHDVIWGDAGNDIIYGQDGNDLIYGGDDDDLLLGEADDDELHGEDGHDVVSGGSGDDIVTGGEGKDDLKGGWGNDVLDGGEGNDRLGGEAASDIIIGGEGQDQLHGGSGDDVLYGDAYEGTESLQQLRTQLQAQAQASGESSEGADTTPDNTNNNGPIRVEAESMTRSGGAYVYTQWNNDSGDSVKTIGTSTSTTTFSGQSGNYMVVARYFDESGGSGKLNFALNGTAVNNFDLNQDTNHYYTRTVTQNITLNTGDEFTITATENGGDQAAVDYLEFIPLDNLIETSLEQTSSSSSVSITSSSTSGSSVTTTTTTESTFRVEAESMTLVGDYYTESNNNASGGSVIAVANQGEGKALTGFSGEAGYYNIVVGYYDEDNAGTAQISALLNNTALDSWSLDHQFANDTTLLGGLFSSTTSLLGGSSANDPALKARTIASTVLLQEGDIFELTGLRGENSDGDELARIDFVDFIKVDLANENEPATVTPQQMTQETVVFESSFETGGSGLPFEGWSSSDNWIEVHTVQSAEGNNHIELNEDPIDYYQDSRQIHRDITTVAGSLYTLTFQYAPRVGFDASVNAMEVRVGDETLLALARDGSNDSALNWKTYTVTFDGDGSTKTLEFISTGRSLNYGRGARLDDIKLVSHTQVQVLADPANDFLEGGAGDDTVYGGNGNDILYGDSQGDSSSSYQSGSHTYNGHTYLLSDVGTWEEAQIQAQQLGGNLVTLNNADEETWVRNTFSNTERLWTGFSDAVTEGEWQWVSGEAVTYTNWVSGTPYEETDRYDFGTMNYGGGERWEATWLETGWEWNGSEWILGDGLRGIIEINATDNDVLHGGAGHDTLYGNAGDDRLYGDELAGENDSTSIEEESNTNLGEVIRIEAESMSLNGYSTENKDVASDKSLAKTNSSGTATTEFTGDTGYYNIVVAYFDENDGIGSLSASLDGIELDAWQLDQDLGSNKASHQNLVTRTIATQIQVTSGDELQLAGIREGGEYVLVDYVEFVAVSAPETSTVDTTDNDGLNMNSGNDTLYGGVGSDTLEGGAGNDVLDGSDAIAAGYFEQDILGGGLGADTFVVGNSNQAYYLGGGNQDYALIEDFNAAEDIVQLHGSASDYTQQQQGNDTYLSYQGDTADLVAIFKNVDSVNLNTGFTFV